MFCHQGTVLFIQRQQRIALFDAITIAITIENCDRWPQRKKRYTAFGRTIRRNKFSQQLWTLVKETTHHVDFNSLFFWLVSHTWEKCCIYTELRSESIPHFIAAKLGVRPMHDLIRRRFYFKSESFPAICIRYSIVSALLKSESKYRVAKMIWTTVSDSASAFRRVSVRVCMWLVMLAPGSSAQAKLPVRSWHHLPPSHAYTEDNRALLWGSCDLSVQLVCPYFCHPVRI